MRWAAAPRRASASSRGQHGHGRSLQCATPCYSYSEPLALGKAGVELCGPMTEGPSPWTAPSLGVTLLRVLLPSFDGA